MDSKKGLFKNCTQGGLEIAPRRSLETAVLLLNLEVFSVEIIQKERKFKTKSLAARKFINPTQAP